MGLFGSFFSRHDVDWYCDSCDAYLNRQDGFTTSTGKWTCTNCGEENDVSEDNVLSGTEAEWQSSFQVECPRCGGHMARGQGYAHEVWVCEDCGGEAVDDGYGNMVYEV